MSHQRDKNRRIVCVGDVMLDRTLEGLAERISPEAPVPVLQIERVHGIPGGAANVARNISALDARCTLIGVIGADAAGGELKSLLRGVSAISPLLVECSLRPTTEKIRCIAQGQQLLRADRETTDPITADIEASILARLAQAIPRSAALILSDYAKGVLTDDLISTAIDTARKARIPVIVDPKNRRLSRYAGATIVCPNSREVLEATGILPTNDISAEAAAREILKDGSLEAVLITRAEQGMSLFVGGQSPIHIASAAREIFDVVGAGDTVVATLAVELAAGAPLAEAARAANVAAGISVGRRGAATVSRAELHEALNSTRQSRHQNKVLSSDGLLTRRAEWRRVGLRVGFTNGCFDLLHSGHIALLETARRHCDRLIVGLNSDDSVRRLKGDGRPVISQADRAAMLAALADVDAVTIFSEDTPASLIAAVVPDMLIKGAEYAPSAVVGAETVAANGGEVVLAEMLPDRSTSETIRRLRLGKGAAT